MYRILLILLIALSAGIGGWWLGRSGSSNTASSERTPLFYQSPMHPWIKSDKPGKCTICGMDLAPVFDTAQSFDGNAKEIIMLPAGSPRIAGIASTPVTRQPLVRTLRVAGMVDDDQTRHRFLSASVKGRIDKLFVNYLGAEVEEGQPLAELFSRELLATIAEYNLVGGELKKTLALKLRQLGLTDKQITELPKRDPKSLTVPMLAPMSGTVVAQTVYEGQWVEVGEKLLEIADFKKMWFVFNAYERDLPWLKLGQIVEIRTPSHPGRVFKAPIAFIDPNLDEVTRTARVRVELENPLIEESGRKRRLFLHRLYAEATVGTVTPETLTVPRAAVIWPGGLPRVFVDKGDGAYRLAHVELGREGDSLIEIISGVEEGEKVVVQGGVLLDGQAQMNHSHEPQPEEKPGVMLTLEDCPVSEEKLGSMGTPFVINHKGREIQLCCKACRKDFESDPAKYLRKLPPAPTQTPKS